MLVGTHWQWISERSGHVVNASRTRRARSEHAKHSVAIALVFKKKFDVRRRFRDFSVRWTHAGLKRRSVTGLSGIERWECWTMLHTCVQIGSGEFGL